MKEWRVVHWEDYEYTYPDVEKGESEATTFKTSLFEPDFNKYPNLRKARVSFGILYPGDFLFVPGGGSPHEVRNVEDSIAIAGNFFDEHNFDLYNKTLYAYVEESKNPNEHKLQCSRMYSSQNHSTNVNCFGFVRFASISTKTFKRADSLGTRISKL